MDCENAMAKQHNRHSGRNKGPQLSEGERLWKRMSNIFGDDETLFSKHWNAQSIADLLIAGENLARRFAAESKAERIFRAKLDQSLAEIRKSQQYFTNSDGKTVKLRTRTEIDDIKNSINEWRSFFDRHSTSKQLFQGPITSDSREDTSYYDCLLYTSDAADE